MKLSEIVKFKADRLFNGAVNVDWLHTSPDKAKKAAELFVFHGPEYHDVSKSDEEISRGHRLIDTANFVSMILKRTVGLDDTPFTLAIAGYGTGKSHLAVTITKLFRRPSGDLATSILDNIKAADIKIAEEIRDVLQTDTRPLLVITLNGMRSFDLTSEITRQIIETLKADHHDTQPLDNLRQRFTQAIQLVKLANDQVKKELLESIIDEYESIDNLIQKLEYQNEDAYKKVYDFFKQRGMQLTALAGESLKDVLNIIKTYYCGDGKPYRGCIIIFDEFGKYMEFATIRSHIAGSGVLQELFEAVQIHSSCICFVGFIQFELNAYLQRIAPEFKNEILRYVTRYQNADKLYLSINLETLIANLIEKNNEERQKINLDSEECIQESKEIQTNILKWFPVAQNYKIWTSTESFHRIIRKGCWPLSPYTTWLLFYLAAAGKHLQERSALALLSETFSSLKDSEIKDINSYQIYVTDLWSEMLLQELISAEELGQQGAIAHSYTSVITRYGKNFSKEDVIILQAILLSSKLNLIVNHKQEAINALEALSGFPASDIEDIINNLQNEFNVIEWDEIGKNFDILGDTLPRAQFLTFLKQRVASSYDEQTKANLFQLRIREWCETLFDDIDCDFADEHQISTREWRYKSVTSNINYLHQQIQLAADNWSKALNIDSYRGTVIYTYIEPSSSFDNLQEQVRKFLKQVAKTHKVKLLPIIVVFLEDSSGILGQAMAEYATIEEMSKEEKTKYGNLVQAHREKLLRIIEQTSKELLKEKRVVCLGNITVSRLDRMCSELFNEIYTHAISFPFDGFSTIRGNAAISCQKFTRELLLGHFDYEKVLTMPPQDKNRAINVLKNAWGIFNKNGTISRRPSNSIIKSLTEKWDKILLEAQMLNIRDELLNLCRPPYGANIASAGLFLGVFVAARNKNLIIDYNGQTLTIPQWIEDDIFKGKLLDLNKLENVRLLLFQEGENSPLTTLLDEWEQVIIYQEHLQFFERFNEIQKETRIIPPNEQYRIEMCKQKAFQAHKEIDNVDSIVRDAWQKLEYAKENKDSGNASLAARILQKCYNSLLDHKGYWSEDYIKEVENKYGEARLYTIKFFPEWINHQIPNSYTSEGIIRFKNKMLKTIGPTLQKIGLEEQYKTLLEHTNLIIKDIEKYEKAQINIKNIQNWLEQQHYILERQIIDEIKTALNDTKRYIQQIKKIISENIQVENLYETLKNLQTFQERLEATQEEIRTRAKNLWKTSINTVGDIDTIENELEILKGHFVNSKNDTDDFLVMQKALRLYKEGYNKLSSMNLSWEELKNTYQQLLAEISEILKDEELPWDVEEVLTNFYNKIIKKREDEGELWLQEKRKRVALISKLSVTEANQLSFQLLSPPIFLTDSQKKELTEMTNIVNNYLEKLTFDWIIEKFKTLSPQKQKELIQRIQNIKDTID